MTPFRQISKSLAACGLVLRGGINFEAGEARPEGPSGAPARAVLLVGNAGAGYWPIFQAWLAGQPAGLADPLDTWSREVIGTVGKQAGARLVMPNDRPYQPFQQWAMRAEGLLPSPLGVLMHPDYGPWHAYRAALLFDHELVLPDARGTTHPCDLCDGKPCMKACPVGAHGYAGFAYEACLSHVRGELGGNCRAGCLDRNACPVGVAWRYPAEVQAFHQRAFAGI